MCCIFSNCHWFQCWCISKCLCMNNSKDHHWYGLWGPKVPSCIIIHFTTAIIMLYLGRQHHHWTVDVWKHIIMSDNSGLQLYRVHGCLRVWRETDGTTVELLWWYEASVFGTIWDPTYDRYLNMLCDYIHPFMLILRPTNLDIPAGQYDNPQVERCYSIVSGTFSWL